METIMKFTTFLSLVLHGLLICQFNPLFSMKRKNSSIPACPAKQPKLSFNCPLEKQHCKEKNMTDSLCTNNNYCGFEIKEKLKSHLLIFHHACPECPYLPHTSLENLSAHLEHKHKIKTSICSSCFNYIADSSRLYLLDTHQRKCIFFQNSFPIKTKNQLQNKRVRNSGKNKPPAMSNLIRANDKQLRKDKISVYGTKALNEKTGGNFEKYALNFTLPQADKKALEQNSSFHPQQRSFPHVSTLQQQAPHHRPDAPLQNSFSINVPAENRLKNQLIPNLGKNKIKPMSEFLLTDYQPPRKDKISVYGDHALNEHTSGNFEKYALNFTLPQDNATPTKKDHNQNSSIYSQQSSFPHVSTHQKQTPHHEKNTPQLVAYNANQSSQYPFPPLEFLPNPLDLTQQEIHPENKSINAQRRLQQNINFNNNYYTITKAPTRHVSNIPLNHPTTTMGTESCGIEMPGFASVSSEFYLDFPHLPGALTAEYMPWALVACSSCPEKFTSHQDMKKHAVSAHLECPQLECTHKDSTATQLMIHTTQEHFHENVFIFPCLHCNAFAATDRQETIAHQQHCSS